MANQSIEQVQPLIKAQETIEEPDVKKKHETAVTREKVRCLLSLCPCEREYFQKSLLAVFVPSPAKKELSLV